MLFESRCGNGKREPISNELLYKSEVLLYCSEVLTDLEIKDVVAMEEDLHQHHTLTWEHSARMARGIYHMLLTVPDNNLGITPQEAFVVALLHDVGKRYIDPETLNQSGSLNESQWVALKRHQLNSALMLQESTLGRFTFEVFYHHEKYDGTGAYGLKGEEIPKISRLLAIFDAYDAMIHDRGYNSKNIKPPEYAISELLSGKGTAYDPDMVDAFVQFKADTNVIVYDYLRKTRFDLERYSTNSKRSLYIPLTSRDAVNA